MGTLIIYLSSFLCLFVLLVLIKFLKKVWWTPIHIRSLMESQGIKGPSYRFFHGNTKEIINMRNGIMISTPMELSHHIFPRIQPHIYSWIKLYGMNFLNWHGPQAQLVVTQPELIKEILSNKVGEYSKVEARSYGKKLFGDGLVTTNSDHKWYRLRKVANHAFHAESLKGMIPAMIASVEMMLERWKHHEGKEIEVFQEFKVLTSEIISRTAFGSSYKEGEKIFDMLMKMTLIISGNLYKIRIPGIHKFLKTRDDIESDKLQQGIRDSVIKMIENREAAARTQGIDSYGNDFLGSLIKAYHDPDKSKKISLNDLIDECKTFYFAGYETTSRALTWTVLLLAIHTDWQDKARKEVLESFDQNNPNPDGISRLKTMSMIINESLRLYSPIQHLRRKVDRETKLGKFIVPANTEFYIPTIALHSNSQIWGEDVHLFKPDRFAEGAAKATNNNMAAFLPFGLGPRSCVGMTFATTQTKIALSMILQRYKFTLSPTYVHSPVPLLTIGPQHGLQIILQPLKTKTCGEGNGVSNAAMIHLNGQ